MTETRTFTYRAMGMVDDVTTCEICGKPELKGTVRLVIIDADGAEDGEVYAGVTCAARRAGRKASDIRTEAVRADRERLQAKRDAHRAWSDAHHAQYMSRLRASVGEDSRFAERQAWSKTPEAVAAETAWLAANPEPAQ